MMELVIILILLSRCIRIVEASHLQDFFLCRRIYISSRIYLFKSSNVGFKILIELLFDEHDCSGGNGTFNSEHICSQK